MEKKVKKKCYEKKDGEETKKEMLWKERWRKKLKKKWNEKKDGEKS